jgi:hypothetical protein
MSKAKKMLIVASALLFCIAGCKKNETTIGAKKLDCTISGNTTLTNHNNGVDYICDCDVQVMAGTLTIEKGVTIQFSSGGGISINGNAAIVANGSASEPITLQGANSAKGSWLGLLIQSNNTLNEISYTNILSAGSRNITMLVAASTEDPFASIHLVGRLKMNNSLISKSEGNGLVLHPTGNVTQFSNNTIEFCDVYPIYMYVGQLAGTSFSTCTMVANSKNFISLYAKSSVSVVVEAVNFTPATIPFYAHTSLNFEGNVAMAAGTQIVVAAGELISVKNNASMRISGTPSNPVVLKGENAIAGFWKGVLVASNNANNIFDYLEVSDGGSEPAAFASPKANITVSDLAPARLTLNNCQSLRADGCQLTYSIVDATVANNSAAITDVCAY